MKIVWNVAQVFIGSLAALSAPVAAQLTPKDLPAGQPPPLRIEVNSLLIPVVIRDPRGEIVSGLTQADFKVFDQGKQQAVTGFSILRSTSPEHPSPAAVPTAAEMPTQASSAPPTPQPRSLILLFDDRHLTPTSLIEVQKSAAQVLDRALGPADHAVVLSFLGTNSGFTSNHAALEAAMQKIRIRQNELSDRGQCPDIDYYAADQILNKHSDTQFQIEIERAANCSHKGSVTNPGYVEQLVREAANQALIAGDQDAMSTVSYMRDVVHSMGKLRGQRTLILISPGFDNFSDEAMRMESQVLDMAAQLNVIINAIDARGLSGGDMKADQSGAGSVFSQITGQTPLNHHSASSESADIMADLADGTGGYFLRGGGNDLGQQLLRVTEAPGITYLLEVSLKGIKQNGSYHQLRIKVARDGAKIQARRGYFAPKPSKSAK